MSAAGKKDESSLLKEAVELFCTRQKNENLLPKLKELNPGYSDAQYVSVYGRTEALFDMACKMVFGWASEAETGAIFELPDKGRIFIDELARRCKGFSDEEYNKALAYAFETTIF